MMKQRQKLNIRPTSGVYATYKRLSYQPWSAIAEFVDNSTQSFFDHIDLLKNVPSFNKLRIEIHYEEHASGGDVLTIKDNAFGMEIDEFERAIILDKPPANKRGRNEFGMGLKTAACWFGSYWTVESTQYGSKNLYKASVDVDKLQNDKDEEIDVDLYEAEKNEHYTVIKIERLNQKIRGSRTKMKVKDLLRSIYREDLRSGQIEIVYNGELLKFNDPEIYEEINADGTKERWIRHIEFDIEHEGKQLGISGFIAIRIPGSVKEAGFTLIRRGRVIIGGPEKNYRPFELFGESNSYAYQRLFGELHMDSWPVTQAKDDFDWHNSGLEEIFIEKLKEFTKPYRDKAEVIRVRPIIDTNQLISQALNGLQNSGIIEDSVVDVDTSADYVVKDNPAEDAIKDGNEESIDQQQFRKTKEIDPQSDQPQNHSKDALETGIIVQGPVVWNTSFQHNGKRYDFVIELETQNPLSQWVIISLEKNNQYRINLNMKHPFFKPYIDKSDFVVLMTRFVVALALAEIEASLVNIDGKIESSAIRLKMNKILEVIAQNGGL
ncbi:ATP-binding protein [Paenibacillus sp. V4I5]|uniref:ATP-binding protein n=1 Tax=Paenibacillus sp. V4I5 TaxID=3042306 RepID=UPI002790610B|nr:ATP-binding protein [Paenibacillus sp. V4I5]MDQ0919161.1 hypothetical protein [Paenibacillus sp. V4I5]